jgi:hypothetical protein
MRQKTQLSLQAGVLLLCASISFSPFAAYGADAVPPPPPGEIPPPPGEVPPTPGENPNTNPNPNSNPNPHPALTTPLSNPESIDAAKEQGRLDSEEESTLLIGAVSSAIAGVVGTIGCCLGSLAGSVAFVPVVGGIAAGVGCAAVAAEPYIFAPDVPLGRVANRDVSYQVAYADAYKKELRFRRARSAFIGGAIATVIVVGLGLLVTAAVFSIPNTSSGP